MVFSCLAETTKCAAFGSLGILRVWRDVRAGSNWKYSPQADVFRFTLEADIRRTLSFEKGLERTFRHPSHACILRRDPSLGVRRFERHTGQKTAAVQQTIRGKKP
jgi:hypothetical protein